MPAHPAYFAIKTEVRECKVQRFSFDNQKTMYGGKHIAVGDQIFLFASENEGGLGLFGRGVVAHAENMPRTDAVRQTPRVSIEVNRIIPAKHVLGRAELRNHRNWSDGKPETELNSKLYRQATNKIVGLSAAAGEFLESYL